MKRRTALLTSLALAAQPLRTAWAAPAQPGQAVIWPDVSLLGGGSLSKAQLGSSAAVVVFWTTTCPFCRRHNQHLEKLHRAALAAGLPLRVLGVARASDADAVRRYAQQQGYSFPITLDHAPLAAALSERKVIPLTAVVDRQGRLKQVLAGEMFEEDLLELLPLASSGARS